MLGITVAALVFGGIVLAAVAGYFIEHTPEAGEHEESLKERHKTS